MITVEEYTKQIDEAARFISEADSRKPQIGIILGSGLGSFADKIQNSTIIPYQDIPGFPVSTAVGHKGNLIIGEVAGKCVLAMQGRFHFYEGYPMEIVTLPERVMSRLGIKYLFVSNAAGGLNPSFEVGDLMIIRDHINTAPNPLVGPNLNEFGPRFPDMGQAYNHDLIKLAKKCASNLDIEVREGTYVVVTGPTYETKAECGYYRIIGGDAIGMSTVPEVIVACHSGIKVFGISVITDIAHDIRNDDVPIDENEVVKAADLAASRMSSIFEKIIGELNLSSGK